MKRQAWEAMTNEKWPEDEKPRSAGMVIDIIQTTKRLA
jgi:hypothetical protein